MHADPRQFIEAKMHAANIATPTIKAFLNAVQMVRQGERGLLPEAAVEPVTTLPRFDAIARGESVPTELRADLLRQLVVVKLNGGLGTSMGLDRAKSLLPVRTGDTFLDFIARQILHLRQDSGGDKPAFYLMDSFSTQADTLEYLARYSKLKQDQPLDFLQNMVPRLDAETLAPVSWPTEPELEWCPPGHGDLYPALLGSGLLANLQERGIKFMFVSNSDNLGATVDLALLHYFATRDISFLMEVAERTPMDRKGGHLTRRRANGRLLLREAAQCPPEDESAFQDIERHQFFNTNNIWVRLDHLQAALEANGGALPLPLITNVKNVDPRNPQTPHVLQLESAMGAAIESFERSDAVVVPRSRFAPVKNTSDLLVLRSDACHVTEDHRLVLDDRRRGQPPIVDLDPGHYQQLATFDRFFAEGPPSLIDCRSLQVKGPIAFQAGVTCVGDVRFNNRSRTTATVPGGTYRDEVIDL